MAEKVALALGVAALTGLVAQLRVPLPFTLESTTGEVFAVLLAGVLLGRWYGGLSLAMYAAVGAAGVNWFAGWSGGLGVLTGATGGYILGFVVAALAIGWLTDRNMRVRRFLPLLGIMVAGVGIIYLSGVVWLAAVSRVDVVENLSRVSILADLAKAAVVAAIVYALLPETALEGEVEGAAVAGRRGFSLPFLRRGSKRLTRVGRPIREVEGKSRPVAADEGSTGAALVAEAAAGQVDASVEASPAAEVAAGQVDASVEASPVAEVAAEEPKAEAPMEAPPAAEAVAGQVEAPASASPVAEEEDRGRKPTKEERSALYSGEVELALAPPLDAAVMSRLHSLLLGNPELKILRTVGSWERGTTITVFLDRALPLVGVLTEIPEIRLSSRRKAGGPGGVLSGRIAITMDSGRAAEEAPEDGE